MSERKARVTVTLDRELLDIANRAVRAGEASSISSWVNRALSDRAAKERRLRAMDEAIRMYEAEFGEITQEEMDEQRRADRANAIRIRPSLSTKPAKRRRRRAP